MTAPGNLPVVTSLLKNSVMRSSLSGEGETSAARAPPKTEEASNEAASATR